MANVIEEAYESSCTESDNGERTWTRNFVLKDSDEAAITPQSAYAAASAYAKANKDFDGLHAKSLKLDEDGDGARRVWRFSIDYTVNGGLGTEDTGSSQTIVGTLRFSTKGESVHINNSISTTVKKNNPNLGQVAPDFKGLINVQEGVPVGVDIQVPTLRVDVTAKIPTSKVTSQWLAVYYGLTGKVNSDALWGFPAHTLIFRGLDGNTNGAGVCDLTFSFDYSPNVQKNMAPFGQFDKNGWEYVWVHNTLTTDTTSNTTVATPDGLYVEKVYEEVSFQPFQFIVVY